MIRSFRCNETEKVFNREFSKRLPPDIQPMALKQLRHLHRVDSIRDLMASPGVRLEKLKGNREGQCSVRINKQWRICFRWHESNAYDVEIVDYH